MMVTAGGGQASATAGPVLFPTRAPPRRGVQSAAGGVRPRENAPGDAKRITARPRMYM